MSANIALPPGGGPLTPASAGHPGLPELVLDLPRPRTRGPMLLGIASVVAVAILASYGIGRLLGLPVRMALLVACGNSICGNSAIAAVAPVIGADGDDVAASIAFTAVLGVLAVLGLPLLAPLLGLSGHQYGVLAGLTVYAVPQVLAATAPVIAITAPTDRSMPRVAMTRVMPIDSSATGAPRFRMSITLP